MKITRFDPKGIQLAEVAGIDEFRRTLPSDWFGFSNLLMRQPGRRSVREIDVVIVTHDRIILVDLKHWKGRIENRENSWYQDDERRERSAALKIRENAVMLAKLLEREAHQLPRTPWIEGFVVFTHPKADIAGLSEVDRQQCMMLGKFLKLADRKYYNKTLRPTHYYTRGNPLNEGNNKSVLSAFFNPGRNFEPRQAKFAGYRPESEPNFQHPAGVFEEYFCELETDPNFTALLRLWDFTKLPTDLSAEEVRRPIAEREHAVLGYVGTQAPELFDQGVLRPTTRDDSFGIRFWELFQARRSLERVSEYVRRHADRLDPQRRLELASLFLSRVAELHRIKVAHRDLAGHSVWVDQSARIVLSGFAAANYPERETIGDKRVKVLAAGARLPEDANLCESPSTPSRQDVFLAAAVCWTLLSGEEIAGIDGVPIWQDSNMRSELGLPDGLGPWFTCCLAYEPQKRYADSIEAYDAFRAAVSHEEHGDLALALARHALDIDLMFDFPPTRAIRKGASRIYVSGGGNAAVLVKHWPDSTIGDRRRSAASLLTFLSVTEDLQVSHPTWVPEVVMAGLCSDGLVLVQRWVDAPNLEEVDLSGWDAQVVADFLGRLVQTVEELHTRRMVHGDLKPANILVTDRGEGIEPILVDFPDYSPPDAGERMTAAYCPEAGASDPQLRDRYAICHIIDETLARVGGPGSSDLAQRLLDTTAKLLRSEVDLMTLRPLLVHIERSETSLAVRSADIGVGFQRCSEPTTLLPDNGLFHVLVDKTGRTLRIVGMDEELKLIFDPAWEKIVDARLLPASSGTVGYAIRNADFPFKGTVKVYPAGRLEAQGVGWLTAQIKAEEVSRATATPIRAEADEVAAAPIETKEQALGVLRPFPVVRFWNEVIKAEEDILPEVKVIGRPERDSVSREMLVPCDEGPIEIDFGSGQTVYAIHEGRKVGELDVSRSGSGTVALRNVPSSVSISQGSSLRFQSHDDRSSFNRRARAVRRIISGLSEVRDLIHYFDPATNHRPRRMAESLSPDVLARYGLNEQQEEAFRHLWVHGPVGLLQGPPGTGKTKFISSFIHYALTEGGMRNVLILSQSHEAANNAAEKVLERARQFGDRIDLLRVGQQGKVSPPLLPYHSDLVQENYRELFRAEMKERLAIMGRRLGLPATFVAEAFELDATIGQVVRQILSREKELREMTAQDNIANTSDASVTKHKLRTLHEAYQQHLQALDVDSDLEPELAMGDLHGKLIVRHGVRNPDAVARLRRAFKLAHDWAMALTGRQRNLEEFFARSRNLVCGTCVGIGRPALRIEEAPFDLVVIDEAARCNPGELAVGMQSGRRILLVGDHRQLPPLYEDKFVKEVQRRLDNFSKDEVKASDFERAFTSSYGRVVGRTLKIQYRMAPEISKLVSECFYSDVGLETGRGDSPPYYSLLPQPLDHQLLWVDTTPIGRTAHERSVGTTYQNRAEAEVVLTLLKRIARSQEFMEALLADLYEGEPAIGVICMYSAQRTLVREQIAATVWPDGFEKLVKVDTVDGYQGKENRIVILSLVRSNPWGRKGHVRNKNRVNVALSRAMERLVIVGSGAVFAQRGDQNPLAVVWQRLTSDERVISADALGQEG